MMPGDALLTTQEFELFKGKLDAIRLGLEGDDAQLLARWNSPDASEVEQRQAQEAIISNKSKQIFLWTLPSAMQQQVQKRRGGRAGRYAQRETNFTRTHLEGAIAFLLSEDAKGSYEMDGTRMPNEAESAELKEWVEVALSEIQQERDATRASSPNR